ncbi:hypothetical protein DPMN_065594 [Dreissena polymorpha]|uniref:Uncharacterized protein n=1 Tax=Dreissena polymorpha TaxID=45954 RepID=A0A9D3YSG8_DREPO|nr:hypothetical protein DPMN_065594 [Dreissena polymorpha]
MPLRNRWYEMSIEIAIWANATRNYKQNFEINGDDAVVGDRGVAAAAPAAADDDENDDVDEEPHKLQRRRNLVSVPVWGMPYGNKFTQVAEQLCQNKENRPY